MTPGRRLYNFMVDAGKTAGGKLNPDQWVAAADAFLADFLKENAPKKAARKVNVLGKGLTDEEWFAELAKDPDLAGIDVVDEARRCRLHFKGKLTPSRARLMKWFSRADPKLSGNGVSKVGSAPAAAEVLEPDDWRALMRDDPDEQIFLRAAWGSIDPYYQRRISRKCAAIKREGSAS